MSDGTIRLQDDRLLVDQAARRLALDTRGSFLVEAPAGAGKTELINQRFLALLAQAGEPEEIVAITFTNKAAAEMRHRALDALRMAMADQRPPEPHRQATFDYAMAVCRRSQARGWRLLEQPERLRIRTIDSLCATLVRQMPLLSRFGAQPEITADPERLYLQAAERTMALLDDDASVYSDDVADAIGYLDNDTERLTRLLAEMLARRDQWLPHLLQDADLARESDDGLRHQIQIHLAAAAELFDDHRLRERLTGIIDTAAGYLSDPASPLAPARGRPLCGSDPASLPQWRAVCALLLTNGNTWRKTHTRSNGFPTGSEGKPLKEAMQALIEDLARHPHALRRLIYVRQLPLADADSDNRKRDAAVTNRLAMLLKLAAANLWQVFQECRQTDFIEVAQRALMALADETGPTDLALKLDYRVQHLLVDEFQDTSPVQIRLLELLTAGWMPGDGRTLFCVGDPMQSIYRFRKADVGLFLQAGLTGIGSMALEPLRLYRNNRSCAEVVDWINTAFAAVFPGEDNLARSEIGYRPFVATRPTLPDAGVSWHPVKPDAETDGAAADRLEALRILEIIDQTWRDDARREIAVLARARLHLAPLVAAIRARRPGLRYQAVEVEMLAGRQWIEDLVTLTGALTQRADRVAWLALLRAPWCGLTLADLHALVAGDREATIWSLMENEHLVAGLSPDGRARLEHLRGILADALAHPGAQPFARWIEGVWLQLDGPASLSMPGDTGADTGAVQDVETFFRLLERLTARGPFSRTVLQNEVEKLYAAPDPAADWRLTFMTIHKAKGLQFDTVILPGLHRSTGRPETPLLRWEEVPDAARANRTSLLIAPVPSRRKPANADPTPYDFLRDLDKERSDNEERRVLYVAATRAIRALHLVGVVKDRPDFKREPSAGASPLGILAAAAGESFAETPVLDRGDAISGDAAGFEAFVPKLIRIRQPQIPAELRVAPTGVTTDRAPEDMEAELTAGYHSVEQDVGILAHHYLEIITNCAMVGWDSERIERLQPAMIRWLRIRGHARAVAQAAAARTADMLVRMLKGQTGRWILSSHTAGAAELKLAIRVRETRRLYIVDRTFIKDGVRWIVDYKTARLPDIATAADFAAHAGRYRAQLESYALLFAGENLPIRTAIYYLEHDRLVE